MAAEPCELALQHEQPRAAVGVDKRVQLRQAPEQDSERSQRAPEPSARPCARQRRRGPGQRRRRVVVLVEEPVERRSLERGRRGALPLEEEQLAQLGARPAAQPVLGALERALCRAVGLVGPQLHLRRRDRHLATVAGDRQVQPVADRAVTPRPLRTEAPVALRGQKAVAAPADKVLVEALELVGVPPRRRGREHRAVGLLEPRQPLLVAKDLLAARVSPSVGECKPRVGAKRGH